MDSARAVFDDITALYPKMELTKKLGSLLSGELNKKSSDDAPVRINGYLLDNYPNPFNPSTMIRFNLPKREHVNIAVYDILGKQIKLLVDDVLEEGIHEVLFSANADNLSLASGVYFVKIQTENFVKTQKILLMK